MSLSSTGTHLFGWCEIVEYADLPRCGVLISKSVSKFDNLEAAVF